MKIVMPSRNFLQKSSNGIVHSPAEGADMKLDVCILTIRRQFHKMNTVCVYCATAFNVVSCLRPYDFS